MRERTGALPCCLPGAAIRDVRNRVVITVTRQNMLAQTLSLIKRADPDSFSFVVTAAEVHGEGFRRYRADLSGSKEP